MFPRLLRCLVASLIAICLVAAVYVSRGVLMAGSLAPQLADEEFWRLVTTFSERAGTFPSDNLLSNERTLQDVIPDLTAHAAPGVYVGVGPEQNFTYIAALKPQMAFIVDIRRGNMDLHLMYKALFELSSDRADFLSKLFSKKRPAGLTDKSTIAEIFDAYENVETNESLYVENVRAVVNHLTKTHGFSLSADDTLRLQRAYRAFYTYGPAIQYSSTRSNGRRDEPTYRDLMVASDRSGAKRSYMATEESFAYLKRFESDNLLVPVIGNFAGPKTLRSVASYLIERGATVSAFYVSNVEEYLRRDGTWKTFCANAATLPLDERSTFIRSVRGDSPGAGFRLDSELGFVASEVKSCDTN
jgi:hypothetical protein